MIWLGPISVSAGGERYGRTSLNGCDYHRMVGLVIIAALGAGPLERCDRGCGAAAVGKLHKAGIFAVLAGVVHYVIGGEDLADAAILVSGGIVACWRLRVKKTCRPQKVATA